MRITLASKSPRRREILERFFPDIRIVPSEVEDRLGKRRVDPVKVALLKAEDVHSRVGGTVIAADTVVRIDRVTLGKPSNREEAVKFLKLLSGRTHEVITGYAIISKEDTVTGFERTLVKFRNLDDELIEWYVETGESMDKAGGYGIQGLGGILVKGIEGDFYNVVGMPMEAVWILLHMMGMNRLPSER